MGSAGEYPMVYLKSLGDSDVEALFAALDELVGFSLP